MIVYDNFNFLDRVRDQALGSSRNIMRNLTTSLRLRREDYPDNGLTQSMHDPSHPLELNEILRARRGFLLLIRSAKFMAKRSFEILRGVGSPLTSTHLSRVARMLSPYQQVLDRCITKCPADQRKSG
jgi:hypothetical protein